MWWQSPNITTDRVASNNLAAVNTHSTTLGASAGCGMQPKYSRLQLDKPHVCLIVPDAPWRQRPAPGQSTALLRRSRNCQTNRRLFCTDVFLNDRFMHRHLSKLSLLQIKWNIYNVKCWHTIGHREKMTVFCSHTICISTKQSASADNKIEFLIHKPYWCSFHSPKPKGSPCP